MKMKNKNTTLSGFVKWFCLIQTDHLCEYQTKKQKRKYYIVRTVSNSNRKIVERGKIDINVFDKREHCMTFTINKLFSFYYRDLNIY